MGSNCIKCSCQTSPCGETPPTQFEQLGAQTSPGITFKQKVKENQDRVFCVQKTILIQNAEDDEMTPMVLKICGVCDGKLKKIPKHSFSWRF